jgi:hypothetical protein
VNVAKKNKKSALAEAAKRRLEGIGSAPMNAEKAALAMLAAERAGYATRVQLDDGTWGWTVQNGADKEQVVVPTAEMLAVLERMDAGS